MARHNHKKHEHCEHEEVAYCGHCEAVYCKGCKREWSDCKLNHGYTYYPWYPYTHPQWTYTTPAITCGTTWGTTDTLTFSSSDHDDFTHGSSGHAQLDACSHSS